MIHEFHAVVDDIRYRYGLDNRVIPVAVLTNVDTAKAYHCDIYSQLPGNEELKMGPGDKVTVKEIWNTRGQYSNQIVVTEHHDNTVQHRAVSLTNCPYCGTVLIPEPGIQYGFGRCFSRACPAQAVINIQRFFMAIGLIFNAMDYNIYTHLVTRGALQSVTDIFYLTYSNIRELDNSLVRDGDIQHFLQLVSQCRVTMTFKQCMYGLCIADIGPIEVNTICDLFQNNPNVFMDWLNGGIVGLYEGDAMLEQLRLFFSIPHNRKIMGQICQLLP